MEINSIRLKNFRQFYGDQTIQLADKGAQRYLDPRGEWRRENDASRIPSYGAFFGTTTKNCQARGTRIVNFTAEKRGGVSNRQVHFTHESSVSGEPDTL